MKTQNQVRITNENVRITYENVQHIGKCIALSAIKKMMRFAHHPRSLDKLYAGLVEDIYSNRGYNTTFSDGYDCKSSCKICPVADESESNVVVRRVLVLIQVGLAALARDKHTPAST